MRARNECDADDEAYHMQDDVNDELRIALQQRQRRRDLEILKTPEIFITQNSKPQEVEEWLRGKGFSDEIVKRLHTLSGEEIFALSPHTIESYFGQRESRRLISQIVLQKNFCEVTISTVVALDQNLSTLSFAVQNHSVVGTVRQVGSCQTKGRSIQWK